MSPVFRFVDEKLARHTIMSPVTGDGPRQISIMR
jgi:hypothetical protein